MDSFFENAVKAFDDALARYDQAVWEAFQAGGALEREKEHLQVYEALAIIEKGVGGGGNDAERKRALLLWRHEDAEYIEREMEIRQRERDKMAQDLEVELTRFNISRAKRMMEMAIVVSGGKREIA